MASVFLAEYAPDISAYRKDFMDQVQPLQKFNRSVDGHVVQVFSSLLELPLQTVRRSWLAAASQCFQHQLSWLSLPVASCPQHIKRTANVSLIAMLLHLHNQYNIPYVLPVKAFRAFIYAIVYGLRLGQ